MTSTLFVIPKKLLNLEQQLFIMITLKGLNNCRSPLDRNMAQVFGDKESPLIIAGNSLLKYFSGKCGDVPYQVVFRPGLILNLFEMY